MRKVGFVLFVWVNKPKRSSHVNSPDWIKCKNRTKNPKNIFSILLPWRSIKRHYERIWNLKAFLNFYHWDDMKYPAAMNNNDYTCFKRKTVIAIYMQVWTFIISPDLKKRYFRIQQWYYWIFSNNENKHKILHRILDDNGDDDDNLINTCNTSKLIKFCMMRIIITY